MNKTESSEQEIGNYLQLFLYRVPKKNHDATWQNLKQFAEWFDKHGVRSEYYQLSNSETMEGVDSITKVFSVAEDEEVWMELSFSRNSEHWEQACAMMVQDENVAPLIKEFEGLATYITTCGFSPLRLER